LYHKELHFGGGMACGEERSTVSDGDWAGRGYFLKGKKFRGEMRKPQASD
jgi:hypothetical protein